MVATPLSFAPGVVIEETTGDQRSVTLVGRAKPYQRVSFPRTLRTKKTTYAGNSEATIQVLGQTFDDTEFEGTWKDRFLGDGDIVVRASFRTPDLPGGSGASFNARQEITNAAGLVSLFESFVANGSTLRVQWNGVVRVGVLATFDPTWIRPQDVQWVARFEWSGTEAPAARASAAESTDDEVRETSAKTDDASIADPPNINPTYRRDVVGRTNLTRRNVGSVLSNLRSVRTAPTIPVERVQAALSAATVVRSQVEASVGILADLPYTVAQPVDTVVEVLTCETWRRSLSFRSRRMRAACLTRTGAVANRIAPTALATVLMPAGSTLRDLARQFYGDADSWQIIADANGFPSSQVRAGTLVIIPPPPARFAR